MMREEKKIAFLFGAGAECKDNFNLCSGLEYLKLTLYADKSLKGFKDALSNYFTMKYFNSNFLYRKNTLDVTTFLLKNFIIYKSTHDELFFNKHMEKICKILNDDELRQICDTLGRNDNIPKHKSASTDSTKEGVKKNSDVDEIKKEFKKIITVSNYKHSSINVPILKDLFTKTDADGIDFDLNVGIAGSIDGYFHTIIDPYKYGAVRFSKIFNYYWACYFTILRDVLNFFVNNGHSNYEEYLSDEASPDNSSKRNLNYSAVLKNIKKLTEKIYKEKVDKFAPENSYYKLIRKKIEECEKIECLGVVTTNYYKFCETVSENVIYLNGQLNLFEYPELLEISDFENDEIKADKIFFPFIFGQSLVKPIISPVQTEQFHRFHNLLSNTDILVILGFNINEDDNHINAFLHDYVKRGKKIIFVTDKKDFDGMRKLKIEVPEESICQVDYNSGNEEVVEKMFEKIIESI